MNSSRRWISGVDQRQQLFGHAFVRGSNASAFDTRDHLPGQVLALALRLGVDLEGKKTGTRLRQRGRMRQDLGSSWMAFRATQSIAEDRCAFDWRARTGPAGLIAVRDALQGDLGRLTVRALGIVPIARVALSPALTRGELLRYLAELVWAPDAIVHNSHLRWRHEGLDQLVVAAGTGAAAAEIMLTLNDEGRIATASAADRPRLIGGAMVPTPWRGSFSDYRRCDGRWIPFAGEVSWIVDEQAVLVWQGRIESWERLHQ